MERGFNILSQEIKFSRFLYSLDTKNLFRLTLKYLMNTMKYNAISVLFNEYIVTQID